MNALKQKVELAVYPSLDFAPKLANKIELPKKNWLAQLVGFFTHIKSDLSYETWENLEYKQTLKKDQINKDWVINHRWHI